MNGVNQSRPKIAASIAFLSSSAHAFVLGVVVTGCAGNSMPDASADADRRVSEPDGGRSRADAEGPADGGEGGARPPWTHYVGSQDALSDWAGWVRGAGPTVTGVVGLTAPVDPAVIEERLAALVDHVAPAAREHAVMLPVGGLESAREVEAVTAFFEIMESDRGAAYRAIIADQTVRVGSVAGGEEVVWQIGNEINSRHYSETMRAALGLPPCDADGSGCRNDDVYLEAFVERFVAPSIEGIRAGSMSLYGDPARARIALGSIANASSAAAPEWADRLLSTTIRGEYAPALAGLTVRDLVHVVTVHYIMDDLEGHRSAMARYLAHVGTGSINGVWNTEEVGISIAELSFGASVGLAITMRYLAMVDELALSPNAARFSIYGWRQGPRGARVDDALTELSNVVGTSALRSVNDSPDALVAPVPEGIERVELVTDAGTHVVGLFANPRAETILEVLEFSSSVRIDRIVSFSPSGQAEIAPALDSSATRLTLEAALGTGRSLLIVFDER